MKSPLGLLDQQGVVPKHLKGVAVGGEGVERRLVVKHNTVVVPCQHSLDQPLDPLPPHRHVAGQRDVGRCRDHPRPLGVRPAHEPPPVCPRDCRHLGPIKQLPAVPAAGVPEPVVLDGGGGRRGAA
eukprot:CAMPEP_0114152242 /NCGR_PEP_ID=MMETSP0043_2-20121206/23693_2 /TAXON_ID=464988 /ORGANISM="Hemiselmis andersenii, Strain CCMP644" /LENGTH=125 /DNA_ID=CAMNT_0001247149 /DNA_START=636 /DNA_END=1013 /DNA_ORIENTATION=-